MGKFRTGLAVFFCLFAVSVLDAAKPDQLKLDIQIRKSVNTHWKPCPIYCHWKWIKAQLIQESSLDIRAVSPVGAKGIAQFMSPTWDDMKKLGIVSPDASPFNWRQSVEAMAAYMQRLKNIWRSKRPDKDRLQLAQASYNGGIGNLLDAQYKCGMAVSYEGIIACLPDITGHHSKETIGYIQRIAEIRDRLN